MQPLLLFLIRLYKILLSPLFPAACRFTPTCSEYTAEAIKQQGIIRGIWLGLKRIARCHPWSKAGFDPLPTHSCETSHHA